MARHPKPRYAYTVQTSNALTSLEARLHSIAHDPDTTAVQKLQTFRRVMDFCSQYIEAVAVEMLANAERGEEG